MSDDVIRLIGKVFRRPPDDQGDGVETGTDALDALLDGEPTGTPAPAMATDDVTPAAPVMGDAVPPWTWPTGPAATERAPVAAPPPLEPPEWVGPADGTARVEDTPALAVPEASGGTFDWVAFADQALEQMAPVDTARTAVEPEPAEPRSAESPDAAIPPADDVWLPPAIGGVPAAAEAIPVEAVPVVPPTTGWGVSEPITISVVDVAPPVGDIAAAPQEPVPPPEVQPAWPGPSLDTAAADAAAVDGVVDFASFPPPVPEDRDSSADARLDEPEAPDYDDSVSALPEREMPEHAAATDAVTDSGPEYALPEYAVPEHEALDVTPDAAADRPAETDGAWIEPGTALGPAAGGWGVPADGVRAEMTEVPWNEAEVRVEAATAPGETEVVSAETPVESPETLVVADEAVVLPDMSAVMVPVDEVVTVPVDDIAVPGDEIAVPGDEIATDALGQLAEASEDAPIATSADVSVEASPDGVFGGAYPVIDWSVPVGPGAGANEVAVAPPNDIVLVEGGEPPESGESAQSEDVPVQSEPDHAAEAPLATPTAIDPTEDVDLPDDAVPSELVSIAEEPIHRDADTVAGATEPAMGEGGFDIEPEWLIAATDEQPDRNEWDSLVADDDWAEDIAAAADADAASATAAGALIAPTGDVALEVTEPAGDVALEVTEPAGDVALEVTEPTGDDGAAGAETPEPAVLGPYADVADELACGPTEMAEAVAHDLTETVPHDHADAVPHDIAETVPRDLAETGAPPVLSPFAASGTSPNAAVVAADEADTPATTTEDVLPADRYADRELSWLAFNNRVLDLAKDAARVPLLERAKFLAIFSSNLDEFFMVRVAGLKRRIQLEVATRSATGMLPNELYNAILRRTRQLVTDANHVFFDIVRPELESQGIHLLTWDDLTDAEKAQMAEFFEDRLFPELIPLTTDPAHPFPIISGLSLNIGLILRDPAKGASSDRFARVKVPTVLPRFMELGDGRYLPMEQVILRHIGRLFTGMEVLQTAVFRVTRNEDIEVEEDDAENILKALENQLVGRRSGRPPVRLEVEDTIDERLLTMLTSRMRIRPEETFLSRAPLDLTCLFQLADINREDLKFPNFLPKTHPHLAEVETANPQDIFAAIAKRDVLLHHPYDSFATSVQEFVRQAAADPKVHTIKITLYRTSGDSPIISSLIQAAMAGKTVLAVVEIKARFDEEANIEWARTLERHGVHVVYGMVGLKTHCKLTLVVRDETGGSGKPTMYAHIGTGNYNPKTARQYEDMGLLTMNPVITDDIKRLFNHLSGGGHEENYRRLTVAPTGVRSTALARIEQEIENHKAGLPARIRIKVNSIVDEAIMDALYRAARAGVPVQMWIRGICGLRPGVPGLSENMQVISILGRFLEHSRIYWFENAGHPIVSIGSADLMHRNLDRRVEVVAHITRPEHIAEIDAIFDRAFDPGTVHWDLHDLTWTPCTTDTEGRPLVDIQEYLIALTNQRKRPSVEA